MRTVPVRRMDAAPRLSPFAARSGAGAGRGDGHGASPGTAAAQTVPRPTIPAALAKAGWQRLALARPIVVTLPGALPVAILGSNQSAVELPDESAENTCSWESLAATLTTAGYRVGQS